jgi:hypothetical protein
VTATLDRDTRPNPTGRPGATRPAPTSPARPRVLLAPVPISPTKPLTPSHLKGLLWTDVMFRATAPLAAVDYRSGLTANHACEQTLGFWEYLDRTLGDVDYSGCSEEDVGELYMRYRAAGERVPFAACRPYLDAIEREGWVHPASARVLRAWSRHYARLGMHDPGLCRHQPPGMSTEDMIERLGWLGVCLDLREHGGPVYLDLTRHGMPLRSLVAADGRPNYLACALRDLLPLAPGYDEVVLLYDRGLQPDYLLLTRVLERLGPAVHRVPLGRVPVAGRVVSARHGGWRGCSAGSLLDAAAARADPPAVRLGMRLYFLAALGPGERQPLRHDVLSRCLRRATRLLSASRPHGAGGVQAQLAPHRGPHAHVDPYRLVCAVLDARRGGPGRELLAEVFT